MKKWFKKNESVIALLISFLALGLQLFFLPFQIKNFRLEESYKNFDNTFKSASILKQYSDDLRTGTNNEIVAAINNNSKLFINNGGRFTSSQIDNYLGLFNAVDILFEKGLIDDFDVSAEFEDTAVKTFNNQEIQNYLKNIREIDPAYFKGLDELVESLK